MANTAPTLTPGVGKVVTRTGAHDFAYDVALQTDGKIVVVGVSETGGAEDFLVLRYNADGTLDLGFGGAGAARTDFAGGDDGVRSVTVQPDGKILLGGYAYDPGSSAPVFAMARYNTDGTLDTTFGGDGKVTTGVASIPGAEAVVLQPDGKILLAGGNGAFGLARFNADGTLDTTFDGDGKVTTVLGASAGGNDVLVQADGKIVVGGHVGNSGFAVVRYNADGSLDSTFGGDGIVTTPVGGNGADGEALALQADGKILLAGGQFANGTVVILRYGIDGTLDSSFDGDGILDSGVRVTAKDIAVQPDGRIVVGGYGRDNTPDEFSLDFIALRVNTDGSRDMSFGTGGLVTTDFNGGDEFGMALALRPDGKLLLAGGSNSDHAFALALYNVDGSLDSGFGPAQYVENGIPAVLDPFIRVRDPDIANNFTGATLTLARHGGANAEDVFSTSGMIGPLTEGAPLRYFGLTIGQVTKNSGGTLILTFGNTYESQVNGLLQAIAYSNTSAAPPASVQIDWLFSDGNTGAQGTGGALTATANTIVRIEAEGPVPWSRLVNGQVVDTFDPDSSQLRFDDFSIAAADVTFTSGPGSASTIITYAGKTVTLHTPLATLTTTNVTFDDGSVLVVGDNTTGVANDNAASTISGGTGKDHLIGLGGADHLTGGAGGDRLDGGPGYDTAHYGTSSEGLVVDLAAPSHNMAEAVGDTYVSIEALSGTAFNDTLIGDAGDNGLSGLAGDDYLQGGGGNDSLGGGDGNDQLEGGPGADDLAGGAGFDYAKYKFAGAAVTVDFDSPSLNTGEAAGDAFNQIEGVIGSRFDDQLSGNSLDNDLVGLDGNDMLFGRGRDDNLQGGNGNDTLDGGAGMDRLNGGPGNDTFVFHKGEANGDTIVDFDGNGVLAGDQLVFQGYGLGATFTQIDATHWSINSLSGPAEVITVANGATILPTDYTFM